MTAMTMMVCPHDTAGDPIKWFQFTQYLTKHCNLSIKHYKCFDFVEFHHKMSEADIVYANPQDSLVLLEKHNYIPLTHSTNLYDEIVFIANNKVKNDAVADLNLKKCLSCNSMMVTRVGIKYLNAQNIKPSRIHSVDNWMAVVKAVSKGEMPYGFVYKDFYDGLSQLSNAQVTKIGETKERSIFHSVFIKKEHSKYAQQITQTLTEAHQTEKGVETLTAVNIEKFISVTAEEILDFKTLSTLGSDILD